MSAPGGTRATRTKLGLERRGPQLALGEASGKGVSRRSDLLEPSNSIRGPRPPEARNGTSLAIGDDPADFPDAGRLVGSNPAAPPRFGVYNGLIGTGQGRYPE